MNKGGDVKEGVLKLIRIKNIKLGKWGTVAVMIICFMVLFTGVKNIYLNRPTKEVFLQQNPEAPDDRRQLADILLKTVLDRAFPSIKIMEKDDNNDSFFKSLLKVVTHWNYRDPKYLIVAELPIMGSYNIATPNRGGATGPGRDNLYDSKGDLTDILNQYKPGETSTGAISEKGQEEGTGKVFRSPGRTALDMDRPVVLIYHTHTSEAYKPSKAYNYTPTDVDRTIDPRYTVVRVGKELKNILDTEYNIKSVHVTTFHDYPEYTPAYSRSLKTVRNVMEEYPSIKIIVDVHRDAFRMRNSTEEQNARALSVMKVGGQDIAKLLLVWGPDAPNSSETRKFAELLKNKINGQCPGLCRGVLEKKTGMYNQQLSDYAVLLEVGSNSSTMEEALRAVPYLAKAISEAVKEIKE